MLFAVTLCYNNFCKNKCRLQKGTLYQITMLKSKFMTVMMMATTTISMIAPVVVHAEDGVQDNYQEYDSKTSKWGDSSTKTTTKGDSQHDGSVHIEYDTNGGWDDSGTDPSKPDDNHAHDAGTYVVTIPTLIKHTGLKAGTVDVTDTYTVNVRGSIPGDKKVKLVAETGKSITNAAGNDSFTETTTQGKTEWNANELYGTLNTDGSVSGTDATDSIKLSGEAKTSGTYTGTIGYTASLILS